MAIIVMKMVRWDKKKGDRLWDEMKLSCLSFLGSPGCDDKILTQVLENGNGIERCRMTENLVGNKCSI